MPAPEPISPSYAHAQIGGQPLETWKEIAAYLNRDLRTVKRWEHSRGLPVHRLPGGSKGSVYAFRGELDAWRQSASSPITEPTDASASAMPRRGRLVISVSVLLLVLAALILWHAAPVDTTTGARVTHLTSLRGVEWFPAFSLDGKQVAFSWNGEQEGNYDLYTKLVDLGKPLRLTADPDMDLAPVWSPDGRQIAFLRWRLGSPKYLILTVPALGGAERRVAQGSITPNAIGIPFPFIAWTPDGRWLIIADTSASEAPYALKRISPETRESRWLTSPPPNSPGDCCPALSPDGRLLAFLRATPGRAQTPVLLPIAPNGEPLGTPQALDVPSCRNPLWSGRGSELLCVMGRGDDRALWRIPVGPRAIPQRVPSIGPLGDHFAVSPQGDRLIYSNYSWEGDIWQVSPDGSEPPVRLITSTGIDLAPQFSPDGAKIVFLSDRSGHLAVWIADRDGANARELTPAAQQHVPQWSPNGEQVAYACRIASSQEDICLISADGGTPRQLTRDLTREMLPSWSRDGRWVYFASDRSGTFQTWKMLADGSAPATPVTKGGGFGGFESVDGKFLYFARTPLSGLVWRVSVNGGDEAPAGIGIQSLRLPQNFALAQRGIFYASSENPERQFELRFHPFSAGRDQVIARIQSGLGNGMAVSPDGTRLLFSTSELRSGDLILVENFR